MLGILDIGLGGDRRSWGILELLEAPGVASDELGVAIRHRPRVVAPPGIPIRRPGGLGVTPPGIPKELSHNDLQ